MTDETSTRALVLTHPDPGEGPGAPGDTDLPRRTTARYSTQGTVFVHGVRAVGMLVLVIVSAIGAFLGVQSVPTLRHYGWSFFTEFRWLPSQDIIGIGRSPNPLTTTNQSNAQDSLGSKLYRIQVATDRQFIATSTTTNAPAAISAGDILKIYNGTITIWKQITGFSGTADQGNQTIIPLVLPTDSGMWTTFVTNVRRQNGLSADPDLRAKRQTVSRCSRTTRLRSPASPRPSEAARSCHSPADASTCSTTVTTPTPR